MAVSRLPRTFVKGVPPLVWQSMSPQQFIFVALDGASLVVLASGLLTPRYNDTPAKLSR